MKFAVALALLLSACSHAEIRHPAPFGFFGVQCEETREVVCVPDADMSATECHLAARAAIAAINAAAGRPLYVLGADLPADASALRAAVEAHKVPVWTEALPEGVLGVTGVKSEVGSVCIAVAFVRLNLEVAASPIGAQVLTHELVHALGGGHAQGSGITSLMTPAISDPGASALLTPGDQEALARTYGER